MYGSIKCSQRKQPNHNLAEQHCDSDRKLAAGVDACPAQMCNACILSDMPVGTASANEHSTISHNILKRSNILQAQQSLLAALCLNGTLELAKVTSLLPADMKLFTNPALFGGSI